MFTIGEIIKCIKHKLLKLNILGYHNNVIILNCILEGKILQTRDSYYGHKTFFADEYFCNIVSFDISSLSNRSVTIKCIVCYSTFSFFFF